MRHKLGQDVPVVGQIPDGNAEIEFLLIDLVGGKTHAEGVILPSVQTKTDLDVAELAEAEG